MKKLNLFLTFLTAFTAVTGSYAEDIATTPVQDGQEIQSGYYVIRTNKKIANGENMIISKNGYAKWTEAKTANENMVWKLTKNSDGTYSLKNVVSQTYLGKQANGSGLTATGSNGFSMVDNDQENPVSISSLGASADDANKDEYQYKISTKDGGVFHCEASDWQEAFVVSYNGEINSASAWCFEKVADDKGNSLDVAYAEAVAQTKRNETMKSLVAEALPLLQSGYNYEVTATYDNLLVTKADFDNDNNVITSNATEKSEGNIANLIDNIRDNGSNNNFWHSAWQAPAPTEQHYLQFKLNKPADAIAITYWKRWNSGNYPTEFTFLVSNNGTDWKLAQTITGLDTSVPTADNYSYTSKGFNLFGSYQYVRVLLSSNSGLINGQHFTHLSEFWIHPATASSDQGVNSSIDEQIITDLQQAIAANYQNDKVTETQITDFETKLNKYKTAVAQNEYLKFITTLKSSNKLAENPNIGQYSSAAATTLENICKNTNASLEEVENAYAALKASLNAYVFTITSAYTDGYSKDCSIYEDNDNLKWKATNKYDKSMLWKFEDATENTIGEGKNYIVTNLASGKNFKEADYITVNKNSNGKFYFTLNGKVPTDLDEDHSACIHASAGNTVVFWSANAEASTWTFECVGESKNINAVNEDNLQAYKELTSLITACQPFEGKIGNGLNQFTSANFTEALTAAKEAATTDIYENPELDVTKVRDDLAAAKAALTVNQPESGKFYRIKNIAKNKYISSTLVGDREALIETADASTVFYLSEDNRLTNSILQNLNKDSKAGTDLGTTFDFLIHNQGYYLIKSVDRNEPLYAHNDGGDLLSYDFNGGVYADRMLNAWVLEEVKNEADQPKLVKEITEEYATIAAPVALNIPKGIKAYTAKVNGDVATLTEIQEVIPAGVAVVLKKNDETETYNFTFAPSGTTDNANNLVGVFVNTDVDQSVNAYILGVGNRGIGFYQMSKDNRVIAANKAYLVLPAEAQAIRSIIIGGPTTGIEDTVSEGAEAEEYYDLQGRRVMNPTKGIYVTKSGKKVVFNK